MIPHVCYRSWWILETSDILNFDEIFNDSVCLRHVLFSPIVFATAMTAIYIIQTTNKASLQWLTPDKLKASQQTALHYYQ